MLKKEFNVKDVTRLRNIVKGKIYDKSATGVGYTKKEVIHTEGDIWEENDQTWTIKDGIKQNVTKLDAAKKAHLMPLMCPCCNKIMKNKNDKTYYKIHKTCFKCVVVKEDKLKREGKFEEYQQGIKNVEIDNKIKDFKMYVAEKMLESNTGFISEAGDVEKWSGKVNEELVDKHVKEVTEYLESLKK